VHKDAPMSEIRPAEHEMQSMAFTPLLLPAGQEGQFKVPDASPVEYLPPLQEIQLVAPGTSQ